MKEVLGIVLAGGYGTRLRSLTAHRAKPGVPFAGNLRIIDFVMWNLLHSGIYHIWVLTQFRSQSVASHITNNYVMSRFLGHFIEPVPAQQKDGEKWYEGTADAVNQNITMFKSGEFKLAAIFSSDHIFTMDVSQMVEYHEEKESDFTISAMPYTSESAVGQFGVVEVDENFRVTGFTEKPESLDLVKEIPGMPGMCLVSMGNYIADIEGLSEILAIDSLDETSKHDFGKDVIPYMVDAGVKVFVYNFDDNKIKGKDKNFWKDVGTLKAYYDACLDMAMIMPEIDLYNKHWPIKSFSSGFPGAKGGLKAGSYNNIICNGCITNECLIYHSVLSPGVIVETESYINDSILFQGVSIGRDCKIKNTIIDKHVFIPDGTTIGYSEEEDNARDFWVEDGITLVPTGWHP
ncbi:MAG: sugar phosphate nucleotidyltransferase [Patescibacteria group bacterium]|nr:sugar phosphate nucleotidyltransferase [Patescibacteria group bacterium]